MSEIKALKKLRTAARNMTKGRNLENHEECNLLLIIADEIEAEIAKRFMELPVDADGVPIRVGETVYGKYLKGNPEYTVRGFSFDQEHGQWNVQVGDAMWVSQNLLGAKPRTLESILCDALADVSCMGDGIVRTFKADEQYVVELADEIRDLLGGDAE